MIVNRNSYYTQHIHAFTHLNSFYSPEEEKPPLWNLLLSIQTNYNHYYDGNSLIFVYKLVFLLPLLPFQSKINTIECMAKNKKSTSGIVMCKTLITFQTMTFHSKSRICIDCVIWNGCSLIFYILLNWKIYKYFWVCVCEIWVQAYLKRYVKMRVRVYACMRVQK